MDVEQRIERLERQNRDLVRVLNALTGQGVVMPLVRAKSFEAVDSNGQVCVRISMRQGCGWIETLNGEGHKLAELGADSGGQGGIRTRGLQIIGGAGKTAVELLSDESGGWVQTFDNAGTRTVSIGTGSDGSGIVATI
jgi:hypothetical protein